MTSQSENSSFGDTSHLDNPCTRPASQLFTVPTIHSNESFINVAPGLKNPFENTQHFASHTIVSRSFHCLQLIHTQGPCPPSQFPKTATFSSYAVRTLNDYCRKPTTALANI
ncbi:hypothetical protein AVEN_15099-1 [Araneus ventricosus]|uniref:Uncharacterized protein n=1 Tax=Araneus ventricosus TaxID=182803 RepID=A0A4Y2GDB3_ARAVE|nr:hypothetical protein AVEN_15099-1 [Araneus ventricosus]